MFVVHAIVLTFITTPLTLLFYPPKYRTSAIDPSPHVGDKEAVQAPRKSLGDDEARTKFTLVLDKIEQIPAAMTLSQLLQPGKLSSTTAGSLPDSPLDSRPPPYISIDAFRLIELTNRTSAVFKSQVADELVHNDPVLSVFRTFGSLNELVVSTSLSVVNHEDFASSIATHVRDSNSQMVILPWARGATTVSDDLARTGDARNPFDGAFQKTSTQDQTSSVIYSEYIRQVFLNSPSDVALFVDRGGPSHHGGQSHIFLPFFGGPDDRLALTFLVQLASSPLVKATVVRVKKTVSDAASTSSDLKADPQPQV